MLNNPFAPLDADLQSVLTELEKLVPECLSYFENCRNPQTAGFSKAQKNPTAYPETSTPLSVAVEELRKSLLGQPQSASQHPGFMAWSVGAGHSLNLIGKLLEGTAHLTAQTRAQLSVQLEEELAGWVKQMLGWPASSHGLMLSGSAMGNLQALLVARNKFFPEAEKNGLSEKNKVSVYGTEQTHLTIPRALRAIGLGEASFKITETTSDGRIDISKLAARLRAEPGPKIIVATLGSTLCGSFDDCSSLSELAQQHGAWLHVDAAWGGWLAADPTRRYLLSGNQLADSLTLDFHKWPGASVGSALILFKKETDLQKIFKQPSPYLTTVSDDTNNYGEAGLELTRAARSLTPWLILRVCGIRTIAARLGQNCDLALHFATELKKIPGCVLRFPVASNTVVFGFQKSELQSTETLGAFVKNLWSEGVLMPAVATLDQRAYLRCSFLNHSTQMAQVDLLLERIRKLIGGSL